MTQAAISLYTWLMVWCCITCARWLGHHTTNPSDIVKRFLGESKLIHATLSLLVDFQEAQCFFVAAISVASILADRHYLDFYIAPNLPSLVMNRLFVITLGNVGALQITLTQISLYRADMDSLYSLIISTITLLLAGFSASSTRGMGDKEGLFENPPRLDACGGNPSIRRMCDPTSDFAHWELNERGICFYLIVWGILWFSKGSHYTGWPTWFESRRNSATWNGQARWQRITMSGINLVTHTFKIILFLAELSLPPQICIGVSQIRGIDNDHEHNASEEGTDSGAWSFGQVSAVLIWLPVLVKYLYILLCKLCAVLICFLLPEHIA